MNGPDDVTGFDPNGPGLPGKLFGLPFTPETARVVILPVPWEVTVSYHTGTARGPKAVQEASRQIDLFHLDIPEAWKLGAAITEVPDTDAFSAQGLVEILATNPPWAEGLPLAAAGFEARRYKKD